MNRTEFYQWLEHAKACFPNLENEYLNPPTISVWFEGLKSTNLEHAKQVVTELVNGDREMVAYGRFLATVRRGASELAFTLSETENYRKRDFFDCAKCLDSGFISIVDPRQDKIPLRSAIAMRGSEEFEQPAVKRSATACDTCATGEKRAAWLPKFEGNRMVRVPNGASDREALDLLADFWATYKDPRRYAEFDEWGDQGTQTQFFDDSNNVI